MNLHLFSEGMNSIAYDASLTRHRLRGTSKVASNASDGCLMVTRILQDSGLTYKKVVVRLSNGSSVRTREHRHIAQERIINGTDGRLPARREFEDAIGFVVRPLFNEGNILEYLSARPQQSTVKLRLIAEVSSALGYLHSQGIVHGNVCPTNILIGDDGHAMLTDIGIHTAVIDFICVPFGRIPVAPTTRYKSPGEVCCSDDVPPRNAANDVYSFASSTYEFNDLRFEKIMSGQTPFDGMRLYNIVVAVARNGHLRLPQPGGITDGLWQLLQACWSIDPVHRPNIEDVERRLGALLTEDV
ncbi:uncharacterized protein LACBIDRAFT_335202 [Laccaria bicolor S238N-H82]|uniref:Predicted protein n=1 Tax=Laccaria bicolor (strain S238N-H82 / ATCC MYA-4686) TaxID=486041 RepID=B0E1N9_LACBS|nr:uncharacterized protein LACBIDRAFT_335202 [Laccaria bicolor S238N-H82]EDQ99207.1 predicted protein [Laccaria bicolor S238N-H82]|eukprot:XP_001890104.1 predicted protein [Laccaria bicolor S238N-H82]